MSLFWHICTRAVASGGKYGDDYRGPRLRVGAPGNFDSWRATAAFHSNVFFSLSNLNIQKSLKHSNTRKAELAYVRAVFGVHAEKTEPSSPSRHPASERTNTNRSLNMQTEKDVKEPNSAPVRGVLCAQGISKCINTEFAFSCSCTDKYIHNYVKIPILKSILEKKLSVMS